jgi:hypothetical protein
MTIKIRVRQVCALVERIIVFDVEDENGPENALDRVRTGDIDIPEWHDPRWRTGWGEIVSEESELVSAESEMASKVGK